MALIEIDGCVIDGDVCRAVPNGFTPELEQLFTDRVGYEAFVNHIHFDGEDRLAIAARLVESWIAEMHARWPDRSFRIYRDTKPDEVIVRFHTVRTGCPDW